MRKVFKIEIGKAPPYRLSPRYLCALTFYDPPNTKYFWICGRLYSGYVGILARAWRFEFALWLFKPQRH